MTRKHITPPGEEAIVTDPETGGSKGQKLERYDLIPVAPLEELAKVYGAGSQKYEDRNWERGYPWSSSFAAARRHMDAFWDGESLDVQQQRHHLAAATFHLFALMEFELRGLGTDDRAHYTRSARTCEEDSAADHIEYLKDQEERLEDDLLRAVRERNEARDRVGELEAERDALRLRLNRLADAVTDNDHAELLKPSGISGWESVNGWKLIDIPEDGAS